MDMLLDLGKFASLLLSILCLFAVFHTAFIMPAGSFDDRAIASLKMLAVAAAVCWGSGWIFCYWERKMGAENPSIARTLPMRAFWWSSLGMLILFLVSWYVEVYYLPLLASPPW